MVQQVLANKKERNIFLLLPIRFQFMEITLQSDLLNVISSERGRPSHKLPLCTRLTQHKELWGLKVSLVLCTFAQN